MSRGLREQLSKLLHSSNIFANDVKFQIDFCAHFNVVEVRIVVGVRNDAHLESVVGGIANSETYSIYRDTAFVYAKIAHVEPSLLLVSYSKVKR